jgi:LPS-assembly protein
MPQLATALISNQADNPLETSETSVEDPEGPRVDRASTGALPPARAEVAQPRLPGLNEGLTWEYCGPRPPRLGPAGLPPGPSDADPVAISADAFAYDQDKDLLTLSGAVELDQGSRQIRAEEMTYDLDTEQVVATGNAFIAQPGVRIKGTKAQMNLDTDQGQIEDVRYRFTGPLNARGSATEARLVHPELTEYTDIVYTACPPGQDDWSLKASDLTIDREEGKGVARHARLRIVGVPVLYTPYISFPIDDRRKTGFLVPSVGNSSESGFELTTPYYFNIAPNKDATLFPQYMSRRGLLLGGEFRLLTQRHYGELFGQAIANDALYEEGGARGAVGVLYRGRYGSRWSSYVDFKQVSDDQYLEDFGNRLEVTSTRNIERRGDLTYQGEGWWARARLQDYQTVDASIPPVNRPYGRLPELSIRFDRVRLGRGFELGLDGEYDYFAHDAKVHGHRTALQPYAAWRVRRPYGYLIPRLNFYSAFYDLQDQTPGETDNPSYAIPSFHVDSKLIFERATHWFGQEALQTLEPRIFYLYTPFKDQDDQPVFDSSELSFSYSSLFRPNRFTGRDRIGDANQVTIGLTSRTLGTRSGLELLRASVGQILYFEDRKVQIAGPAEDQSSSAIAGEISSRFHRHWSGRASFQWDPNNEEDQSEKRILELHYERPDNRLINLAYRFDLGTSEANRYEDTDLSFRWPVNQGLELVGRWYYSLLYSETMEAFAGVEFGRCCWRVRVLGRHLKNKPETEGTTSVMVQLELAGLGSIGNRIDKFLERGIYGYETE